MSGYQVDLNGPNEMDSQYWAYLSKQVIDTSVEFIRLLDKCKIKMGVKLVPLSLCGKCINYRLLQDIKELIILSQGFWITISRKLFNAHSKKLGNQCLK